MTIVTPNKIDPDCNIRSIYPFYPAGQFGTLSCILPDLTELSYREYEGIYIGLFDTACVYCFRDAYATTLQSVQYYVNGYLQGSEVYHSGDRLVLYLNGGSATFNIRGQSSFVPLRRFAASRPEDTLRCARAARCRV